MNGQQILDSCREIARRQYEGESDLARVTFENDLLRTKVLELAKKLADVQATEQQP